MTTLYRPVLIETAEQAEALPVGTLIAWEHCDLPGVPMVAIKYSNDEVAQIGTHLTDVIAGFVSTGGVLFTALVPIEAEEEFTTRSPGGTRYPSTTRNKALVHVEMSPGVVMETRLVTPWEEA